MKIRGKDISMFRGDSESITMRFLDRTGMGCKLADGDMVRLTVRNDLCGGNVAIQKVVTEFHDGTAVIDIKPEDTTGLCCGDYVYSIRLILADGSRITVVEPHTFTILPGGDSDEK